MLLAEIERWRQKLAQSLALRQELTQRELNHAVQATLARIVFLRICEARAIETDGALLGLTQEILRSLYPPNSTCDFAALPADILGQIHEQFLGKVIRLEGQRAVVDEQPEVRKAGGVYYTPTFIVAHIVEQTVGRALAAKNPQTGRPLAILDAACGSGAFLLGAYQALLDGYLGFYVAEGAQKHSTGKNPRLYPKSGSDWGLTPSERKRILTAHIFGVDLDAQAVEITKLSLVLKLLEGESGRTLSARPERFHEHALADLAGNIKCGNSLVESDIDAGPERPPLAEYSRILLNPFDWKREFPDIMARGGFDAVIGNPPYIDSEWMSAHLPQVRAYCAARYASAAGNWDLFCVFAERAMELTAPGGLTSQLVPNKLGAANYAAGIRRVLTVDNRLLSIRDYSEVPVFRVAAYPIVYVARRSGPRPGPPDPVRYERFATPEGGGAPECVETRMLDYATYFRTPNAPWEIFAPGGSSELVLRLKQLPRLGTIATVLGAATVAEAYEIQKLLEDEARVADPRDIRLVNSGTIDRYRELWGIKPCRYLGAQLLRPVVPQAAFCRLPTKRQQQATTPKIILAGMTQRLEGIADLEGKRLAGKSTTLVFAPTHDPRLLLALLNSRVVDHFYQIVFGGNKLQGGYLRIGPPQVREIPVPDLTHAPPAQVEALIGLVDEMMRLQAERAKTRAAHETTALERQTEALDQTIDRAVAALYGLTASETETLLGQGDARDG